MVEPQWVELLKPLGIAAPLVLLLYWLLRENVNERKQITSQFLSSLQEMSKTASDGAVATAGAIQSMAATLNDTTERHSREHDRILSALIETGRAERRKEPS